MTGANGLSRELLRAISPVERQVEVDLPLLTGKDLSDLKLILRGEKDPGVPVDRTRALNALTRSERSAEAAEILARVLSRRDEKAEVRVTAARDIALMPSEPAEKALLRNLTSEDELVRDEVIRSIGRIGSVEALRYLQELPLPDSEYGRRQLSFARLAIGIRTGVNTPDPQGSLGIRWTEHHVEPIEGEAVRDEMNSLWSSTYGIMLNPDIAFEVVCGRLRHLLFLNAEIKRGDFINAVRSKSMIAGLVALREDDIKHSTIRYLLFTVPSEAGVEAMVVRTNGQVSFSGTARFEAEELRVTMRDVGFERTPTAIEGTVTNDHVQLSVRVWVGAAKAKKHGQPVLA